MNYSCSIHEFTKDNALTEKKKLSLKKTKTKTMNMNACRLFELNESVMQNKLFSSDE